MKAILRICNILIVVFLSISVNAQNEAPVPKFEKTKSYSKSYPLLSGEKLSLDNRFGDIKINLWDKNEVKVDIAISGKSNREELAQELIDRVSIEDGKSKGEVSFKTKITEKKITIHKGETYVQTKFKIDYIVYLPSQAILQIENEFGKTFVPDYKGEISIKQKFGMLTAGKLSNVKMIHVEFSNGSTIESVNGGNLDFRFSRSQINKLEGVVKMNIEHSGGLKLTLENSLKQLTIKNSFTEVYLDVPTNLSANFNIRTNFSELNNKTNFSVKEEGTDNDRRGPKFDHDYSGQTGTGTMPIKINSEFGEVILGHDIKFDVNAKEKNKSKAKARAI